MTPRPTRTVLARAFRALCVWIVPAVVVVSCAGQAPDGGGSRGSSGVSQPGGGQTATPKRLTAAVMGEPSSLSSRISVGVANVPGVDVLEELANSGLVTLDNQGNLVARMAEDVPSVENGLWQVYPDGRMDTTWHLRENAQWHDGLPVTSDDLAFTLQVGRDRELPNFGDLSFAAIDQVDTPDIRTLTIHWKQPFISADTLFSPRVAMPLPKHLLGGPYEEDKSSFVQLSYWSQDFVGTGPYKLREWAHGSDVILDANAQYALGRPKIDQIEVRFIPDQNTLMANILAGTVQVTLGRNLSLEQARQVGDQWKDGKLDVGSRGSSVIWPQFVNPSPSVVGTVQFRRAVVYAIDLQQLVDTLMDGLVPAAPGFVNPNDPAYSDIEPSIVRYDYDPSKATQAIVDLGYTKGSDGLFRDGTGQALTVELRTVAVDIHQKTTLAVADAWQRIGISVDPVVIPPARQGDLEYRAAFPGFQVFGAEPTVDYLARLYSSRSPLPETRYVGTNYSRYQSAEWDGLLDTLFSTIPRPARTRALANVVHHLTDQLNVISLFLRDDSILVDNRLKNVSALHADGSTHGWNAYDWDLGS